MGVEISKDLYARLNFGSFYIDKMMYTCWWFVQDALKDSVHFSYTAFYHQCKLCLAHLSMQWLFYSYFKPYDILLCRRYYTWFAVTEYVCVSVWQQAKRRSINIQYFPATFPFLKMLFLVLQIRRTVSWFWQTGNYVIMCFLFGEKLDVVCMSMQLDICLQI